MIDFGRIEKYSFKYDIFRTYIHFIHNLVYYRKFHVIGKENIPPKGTPVVIVGNHQNGLMDALGILYALPVNFYPVFLARSDIFRRTIVAKLLRWLKIMPVYRVRDGYDTVEGNNDIFKKAIDLVSDGVPVVLFPEAGHQQGHSLGDFKKGFARIAFDSARTENFQTDFYILPVGNHYSNYYDPRSELVISIGKPIKLSDFYANFQENAPKERNKLADVTRSRIEELMLNIDDPENYETIDAMRKIVRPQLAWKLGLNAKFLPHSLKTDQTLVKLLKEEMAEGREDRIRKIYHSVDEHSALLRKMRLTEKMIADPKSLPVLLVRSVLFLVCLPVFLYGFALAYLPWAIPRRLAIKTTTRLKDRILFASFAFGLSAVVTFPLFNTLLTILVMAVTGSFWIGLAFFATLSPTRIVAVEYLKMIRHHLCLFRIWYMDLTQNKDYLTLHKQHQTILEAFDKINVTKNVTNV